MVDEGGSLSRRVIRLNNVVLSQLNLFGLLYFFPLLHHELFLHHVSAILTVVLVLSAVVQLTRLGRIHLQGEVHFLDLQLVVTRIVAVLGEGHDRDGLLEGELGFFLARLLLVVETVMVAARIVFGGLLELTLRRLLLIHPNINEEKKNPSFVS